MIRGLHGGLCLLIYMFTPDVPNQMRSTHRKDEHIYPNPKLQVPAFCHFYKI